MRKINKHDVLGYPSTQDQQPSKLKQNKIYHDYVLKAVLTFQEVNRRPQSAWDRRKLTANTPASQPTPSGPSTKMDKEIGMYQRPKTAHGVRNQQDSTFSIKSFW